MLEWGWSDSMFVYAVCLVLFVTILNSDSESVDDFIVCIFYFVFLYFIC